MEVYLLRHGEAGKRLPASVKDSERGLTQAGRDELEGVGEAMARARLTFDVIASSPLKRARETADIVAVALKKIKKVEVWPELGPGGERASFYKRLAGLRPDAAVLCVGHEPYLTTAIAEMTGRRDDKNPAFKISLKKGGLAKVLVTGSSPRGGGELRWLLIPRQARKAL